MKLRSIIATVIITLSGFAAIFYTSCKKDACNSITCQNGGSCANGYCNCPYGYEGDRCQNPVITTINYVNHTFTDITLVLNGGTYTVHPGNSKGFTGKYNDTLSGFGYTAGAWGETLHWDSLINTYPSAGTFTVDLHEAPNYYYLLVQNDSSSSLIREINANFGLPTERDIIESPLLSYLTTVGVGYFYASNVSNVRILSSTGAQWNYLLNLPLTQDQWYEAVAH